MLWTPALLAILISEPIGASDMSGRMQHQMANCPSVVSGAKTTLKEVKGGLELTIRAPDEKAGAEVLRRAETQAPKRVATSGRSDTGHGTGIGDQGYCPIVHTGTKVSVKAIPNGAQVTVLAVDPRDVPTIRKIAKERLERLAKEGH
jgi:TusA-related sulfurtransferase